MASDPEGLNIYEPMRGAILVATFLAVVVLVSDVGHARQSAVAIPDTPLTFGAFSAQFRGDGTFSCG